MRTDPSFTELLTERLRLRRSTPQDAAAISAYRSDPRVHVTQGWERTDPDHVRADIEQMAHRLPGEPGGWVQFTVEERNSGALVGDVGLSPDDEDPGVIKVGYTVDPAYQRRGYASEAVSSLVAYAFDVLHADVIRAYADAENTPSIRVAANAGLKIVEHIRHPYEGEIWHGVRMERQRET
jgi:RimJ/RimL family protein N-acetyltransferase